jgi:hypothetical protein
MEPNSVISLIAQDAVWEMQTNVSSVMTGSKLAAMEIHVLLKAAQPILFLTGKNVHAQMDSISLMRIVLLVLTTVYNVMMHLHVTHAL